MPRRGPVRSALLLSLYVPVVLVPQFLAVTMQVFCDTPAQFGANTFHISFIQNSTPFVQHSTVAQRTASFRAINTWISEGAK